MRKTIIIQRSQCNRPWSVRWPLWQKGADGDYVLWVGKFMQGNGCCMQGHGHTESMHINQIFTHPPPYIISIPPCNRSQVSHGSSSLNIMVQSLRADENNADQGMDLSMIQAQPICICSDLWYRIKRVISQHWCCSCRVITGIVSVEGTGCFREVTEASKLQCRKSGRSTRDWRCDHERMRLVCPNFEMNGNDYCNALAVMNVARDLAAAVYHFRARTLIFVQIHTWARHIYMVTIYGIVIMAWACDCLYI